MRQTVASFLLIILSLFLAGTAWAEHHTLPQPQAARAVITSPEPFTALRGRVPISGTATHPDFWKYEVHFAPEPSAGDQWSLIGSVHEAPVVDGVLEVWDTTTVPDGTYSLRLRVVRRDGNYEEYFVRQLLVANAQPTETPTPEISPTPTDTPTPLPPTPTVVIELPVIPTPTPRPTPTSTPGGVPPTSASKEGGLFNLGRLTSQIDLRSMGRAFVLGVEYALAAFVAVGAFFTIKRFLGWLWARIRG